MVDQSSNLSGVNDSMEYESDMAEAPKRGGHGEGGRRSYSGIAGGIIATLAAVLPVYVFLFMFGVFEQRHFFIYGPQHRAIFLIVILFLVFMLVPATPNSPRHRPSWYDILMLIPAVVGNIYFIISYADIVMMSGASATPLQIVMALCVLVPLFEATRRTSGWAMVILSTIFLVYAKFGYFVPGIMHTAEYSWGRLLSYTYLSTEGIYGAALNVGATLIIGFMTFGAFLSKSGAGDFFFKIAAAVAGKVRGGPAKCAAIASGLFGTISGSAVSDCAVTGSITIPMMKRYGYSPTFAAAVEAVAGTGGAIMPPVMAGTAFIMSEFSGLGYARIAQAAILPALLYYFSLYFQIDFRAGKTGLVGLPASEIPPIGKTIKEGWMFVVPLIVLVMLLVVLRFQPGHALVWAVGSLIAVSFLQKDKTQRLMPRRCVKSLQDATYGCLMIGPLVGIAGIMVAVVTITGLAITLSSKLIVIAGGSVWVLLTLVAFLACVMGMGVPISAVYILLSILMVPAMLTLGLPVLVAHFFIFYWAVGSFITPPMAPSVFVTMGIAGSQARLFPTGYQAMRLGIVAYLVPFMTVVSPALYGMGTWGEIAFAGVTAFIACYLLCAGFETYWLTSMPIWQSLLVVLAGGLFAFPGGKTIPLALLVLIVPVFSQIVAYRRQRSLVAEAEREVEAA